MDEASDHIKQIIDAKYKAANLDAVVQQNYKQDSLRWLLSKYEDLFDGTLGWWNEAPADIILINQDATP